MNDYLYGFEKLVVWQKARALVSKTYLITKDFPVEEKFGLTNQVRRAATSITANIVEGTTRSSPKEQAYYSQVSYGSLMELLNHFYIALDLGYITNKRLLELKSDISEISKRLSTLRKTELNRHKP